MCGERYPADARFCPRDGTKLERVVSPAPSSGSASAPASVSAIPHRRVDFGKLVGQRLDDRYQILRKIGEGGMSFVYLAEDGQTGEQVAIKILSPQLIQDQNAMARLRREAALGTRLAHPNLCHIVRVGETPSKLVYVVMPYVQGELLCDRAIRLGRIDLATTVRWVADIAAGLHAAHELGIIHRDLKPENVMICPLGDGSDRAVVMDFGLAKERRVGPDVQKLTATGIVLGTPEFMSPEQLRGKSLDPRTDIYSLGLMTFELLTGKLPFAGRTQQEIMIARLKGEPIPLRQMCPELNFPAAVEKVLTKSLQRDPEHRYRTAPEFATALAAAAETGSDGGEGPGSLLDRFLRR